MKKIYLFTILFLASFIGIKAQSTVFKIVNSTNSVTVNDNDVFNQVTTPLNTTEHDLEVTNLTANTITISVRKYEDVLNTVAPGDVAQAYFCTNSTCYPAEVMSAPLVLTANETAIFKADLLEASAVGESSIRYKFTDAANTSDYLMVNMKYNAPVSVKSNKALFTNVSGVYPNPSISKSYVNITSAQNLDGVNISILNSLGALVNSKTINLNSGTNKVMIDSESLSSGMYFISITSGASTATRKIIINK